MIFERDNAHVTGQNGVYVFPPDTDGPYKTRMSEYQYLAEHDPRGWSIKNSHDVFQEDEEGYLFVCWDKES